MSVVGSGSKRKREVVGDFFIDFYPGCKDPEALKVLSSENPIRLSPGNRQWIWGETMASVFSFSCFLDIHVRSQLGSPTCLVIEAMGIDDNDHWKHMQIGHAPILVCLRIMQCLLQGSFLSQTPGILILKIWALHGNLCFTQTLYVILMHVICELYLEKINCRDKMRSPWRELEGQDDWTELPRINCLGKCLLNPSRWECQSVVGKMRMKQLSVHFAVSMDLPMGFHLL